MSKHTKTPWEIFKHAPLSGVLPTTWHIVNGVLPTTWHIVKHDPSNGDLIPICHAQRELIAEHIVKCVNLHDELVRTLEAAEKVIGDQRGNYEACSKIRAAIKKARGEV